MDEEQPAAEAATAPSPVKKEEAAAEPETPQKPGVSSSNFTHHCLQVLYPSVTERRAEC